MSSSRGNEAVTEAQKQAAAHGRAEGLETGYTVLSYLLAGMAAYGIIGWFAGRAAHIPMLFPVGMLLGLGISIGYIIHRFGRMAAMDRPRKENTGDR
jgi:ATP synthase protein I